MVGELMLIMRMALRWATSTASPLTSFDGAEPGTVLERIRSGPQRTKTQTMNHMSTKMHVNHVNAKSEAMAIRAAFDKPKKIGNAIKCLQKLHKREENTNIQSF